MTAVLAWALFIVQILFFVAAVGIFAEFRHGFDLRNLLGAAVFLVAAIASYSLTAWWPLIVGFALLCIFKRMGLDPGDDHRRFSN
jgi:hypothetical protein